MKLLVHHLPVGNLTEKRARAYCEEIMNLWKEELKGFDIKFVVLPCQSDTSKVEMFDLS